MNTSAPKEPVSGVIDDLEQKLTAARKEKTLAQVPAMRRLRNAVRVYVVFGGLSQLFIPMMGVYLRQLHDVVNSRGPNLISVSAFSLYAVITWIAVGMALLLLLAYARFFKQFRENQVRDIEDTTAMILRIWNFYLFLIILNGILPIAILGNSGVPAQYLGNIVGTLVGTLVGTIVMYFVIRHYVKTAQVELPLLVAAAGGNAPRGNYRAWKPLFLMLLVGVLVVLGLGYWLGGASSRLSGTVSVNSEANVEQVLAETSKTINTSLPKQVDSETRLDATTSGPGKRITYFYTLVNFSVADLDQTKFIEGMRQQIVKNYRSNPDLAEFRRMQVELSFVYRDKRGETVDTITVSPSDL